MALYTRRELALLLLLLLAAGAGLGVRHWRAAHPELVERLERLDAEIARSTHREVEEPRVTHSIEAPPPRPPAPGVPESLPPRSRPSKRVGSPPGDLEPPLDLNRATLGDLLRLPGVGPVIARRILDTREEAGRFTAVDDLAAVRGLSRARLDKLRPFIGVLE
jgi:competence ComEA-like helix-hairpin-helix protein